MQYIILFFFLNTLTFFFKKKFFLIVVLTNLNHNYLLIIFLISAVLIIFFNKKLNYVIFIVFSVFLNFFHKDLIALHNTLFVYHPVILYTTIILFFFIPETNKNLFKVMVLMWFSFVLGGYWSSQEFNWGGWWNWDALEMGILFNIITNTIYVHFKKHTHWHNLVKGFLAGLVLAYWFLNKLGLTISIHSFIQNSSLNKYLYKLILLISIASISVILLINLTLLFYLTNMFLSVFFWKLLLVGSIIAFFKTKYFKQKHFSTLHKIIFTLLHFFFLINFNNFTFYKTKQTEINMFFNFIKSKWFVLHINTTNYSYLNNLKKDFFFFKFKNTNWVSLNWTFSLINVFSTNKWFLLF